MAKSAKTLSEEEKAQRRQEYHEKRRELLKEEIQPGGGRPHKEIDLEQLERLAMIQCTYEEIAACMKCDIDTIRINYSEIIEKGKREGKKSLRRLQFEHAKKNAPMAMFLGKVYLDQVDNPQPQGPLKIIIERSDSDQEEIDCNF